jgi:NAD(P)-dependent dehydrogenase (short-subunit alcohol dehydrogenase family)
MKIDSNLCVLIVGGASGLGLETVKLFHSLGAKIGTFDMNLKPLETAKIPGLFTYQVDVSKEDQVKEGIEAFVAHFGQLHAVINCAGIVTFDETISTKPFSKSIQLFTKMMEVNLYGSLYVSKYAAIQMSK